MQKGLLRRKDAVDRVWLPMAAWRFCAYQDFHTQLVMQTPGAFIFRDYHRVMEAVRHSNPEHAHAIALLAASQRFVEFVFLTWRAGVGDLEFLPERFFTREDEVEGFREYMKNLDFFSGFC